MQRTDIRACGRCEKMHVTEQTAKVAVNRKAQVTVTSLCLGWCYDHDSTLSVQKPTVQRACQCCTAAQTHKPEHNLACPIPIRRSLLDSVYLKSLTNPARDFVLATVETFGVARAGRECSSYIGQSCWS
jgi:hypothetical protein